MKRPHHQFAGIAYALVAVSLFAVLDTTTKYISVAVPVFMAIWFRYVFQALSTTIVMLPLHGRRLIQTAHPRFQLLRGLLLLTSSAFGFYSLRMMPVGDFAAIVMVTPLVVTVVAATWLKEAVSLLRWLCVIGGFAGTLLIIRPGGHHYGWSALLPIGLVLTNAGFQVLTSVMARTEDASTTHFYTGLVGALVASLILPLVWIELPGWHWWALLVLMGTCATLGHFLLIRAYENAPATVIMPYQYMQIGFGMLGGYLVFQQTPDRASIVGISLIAVCGAGGAWLVARERRLERALPRA